MVIGTCGFVGTGSSAVADLLRGYKNICPLDYFEFQIVHAPDGLEDLDYHLNISYSKYMSSAVAIERFRRLFFSSVIKFISRNDQKRALIDCCDNFIEIITQTKWKGMGFIDDIIYSGEFYENKYLNLPVRKVTKNVKSKISYLLKKEISGFPLHEIRFSIEPPKFQDYAHSFVNSVLNILGANHEKKILLDQPFSGNYPERSFCYFDDAQAIVVDRDPRDLYLQAKRYARIGSTSYQIPTDPDSFVIYYKRQRECKKIYNRSRVLEIRFEDLIYKFNDTKQIIEEFCGLTKFDEQNRIFNPEISKRGTQLFNVFKDEQDNIKVIERELKEYLYDYGKNYYEPSGEPILNRMQ